jgi:hypothetical protein
MIRLKPIHGNTDLQLLNIAPFEGNLSDGAGNDLCIDSHRGELWENLIQFAVTNQGFAPNQRHMERFMEFYRSDDPFYEGISLEIV